MRFSLFLGRRKGNCVRLPPATSCQGCEFPKVKSTWWSRKKKITPLPPLSRSCDNLPPPLPEQPSLDSHSRTIGAYTLFPEPIGKGSFGEVFKGEDQVTGDIVAIKQFKIKPAFLCQDISLLPDVKYLASCSGHPSIVHLKEFIRDETTAYIIMEYVEYDLRSLLYYNAPWLFDELGIRVITRQLLQGIAHIHSNNTIHRDIKTQNILVALHGAVKICDFGLATTFTHGVPSPRLPKIAGTFPYCAPEMLLGEEYSAPVDLWSAGCVMAEMLYKRVLYPSLETKNYQDKREHQLILIFDEDRESLRRKIPESVLTSPGFDLLTRLLTADPQERITAKEALFHPWFAFHERLTEEVARNHPWIDFV